MCEHLPVGRLRIDRLCGTPRLLCVAGEVAVRRCYVARSFVARTIGLLATSDLAGDEALWLEPCASVHTVGMRVPIACVFLASNGAVLRVDDPLPPGRLAWCRGARVVVEMRAGAPGWLTPGARLWLEDALPGEKNRS